MLLTSNELLWKLTKTANQSNQKMVNKMTYKVYTHRHTHRYIYNTHIYYIYIFIFYIYIYIYIYIYQYIIINWLRLFFEMLLFQQWYTTSIEGKLFIGGGEGWIVRWGKGISNSRIQWWWRAHKGICTYIEESS